MQSRRLLLCVILLFALLAWVSSPMVAAKPCGVWDVDLSGVSPCVLTRVWPIATLETATVTPQSTATMTPSVRVEPPIGSPTNTATPMLTFTLAPPIAPSPGPPTATPLPTSRPTLTSTLTPDLPSDPPTPTATPRPSDMVISTSTPTRTPVFTLRDYDQPGPYAVSAVEWNAGAVEVEAAVTLSGTLSLPLFGVTYYPSLDTGEGQPIAPGGPFPLVVWGHARFQRIDAPNRNHHQTDYLLRHLASWGYIATSVNLDALGIYNNPPAISERAAMLVATITYHLGPTAGAGLLIDGADSRRIALGGLSRGAEAAALAAQVGRYPVRALTLVAPTDTQGLNVSGIATQVLYGSCDGDVVDGAPIRVYERAAPPKQLLYIYGANHYGFTQDISVAPCDLSHTAQHSIAQSAITTFLAYALRGDVVAGEAVRGDRWPLPGLSNYLIYPTYQDPTRLDVDTFEDEPYSLSKNSLAEQNTLSGLTAIEASLDSLTEDCFPGGYECYECLCLIPHTTRGLHLAWSTGLTTTAVFTATLPPGLTLAPYTHLAFRAASRMRPLTAPLDTPQDIRVSLTDTDGHQATLTLSATGQLIPYPYHPPIIPFIPHRLQTILSVMRGVRLPLADFTRQTPTLRLDRLAAIGLQFPAAIGEVIVDDVGFTR